MHEPIQSLELSPQTNAVTAVSTASRRYRTTCPILNEVKLPWSRHAVGADRVRCGKAFSTYIYTYDIHDIHIHTLHRQTDGAFTC